MTKCQNLSYLCSMLGTVYYVLYSFEIVMNYSRHAVLDIY